MSHGKSWTRRWRNVPPYRLSLIHIYLNATLGNFYEQPKNDNAEMDELLERIASLESELESKKGRTSSMDEQVALMEKSYELAAKYMGGQNGGKDRKSTRLNSSHRSLSRMPSSA